MSLNLFGEASAMPLVGKPFIKWVGGKRQLIPSIENSIPLAIKNGDKFKYIEPFVGGGAVLYHMLIHYPNLEEVVINDINSNLIGAYKAIQKKPDLLIEKLGNLSEDYKARGEEDRKEFFLAKRAKFNTFKSDSATQAALFIFLNKTCFNGLYRVNKKGLFNVPHGRYKNPNILDEQTIRANHELLSGVKILNGGYQSVLKELSNEVLNFVYLDPPYKPLNKTSSFNSYSKGDFGDDAQIELRNFCKQLDENKAYFLQSNSDPKTATGDTFFDDIYADFNIDRVSASRSINSVATKRGKVKEILIRNYD